MPIDCCTLYSWGNEGTLYHLIDMYNVSHPFRISLDESIVEFFWADDLPALSPNSDAPRD